MWRREGHPERNPKVRAWKKRKRCPGTWDGFLLLCNKGLGLGLPYVLRFSLAKSEMLPGELHFLAEVQGPLPASMIITTIYWDLIGCPLRSALGLKLSPVSAMSWALTCSTSVSPLTPVSTRRKKHSSFKTLKVSQTPVDHLCK